MSARARTHTRRTVCILVIFGSSSRALFVHGFAVDENGLKMSKSVGNVINPDEILLGGSNSQRQPVYGVDVLRYATRLYKFK